MPLSTTKITNKRKRNENENNNNNMKPKTIFILTFGSGLGLRPVAQKIKGNTNILFFSKYF